MSQYCGGMLFAVMVALLYFGIFILTFGQDEIKNWWNRH